MMKFVMVGVVALGLTACHAHHPETQAAIDGAIVGGTVVCIVTGCL